MAGQATMIWGYHPVSEALRARRRKIYTLYIARERKEPRSEALFKMADHQGAPVQIVTMAELTAMVGHGRHQGIGARVSEYPKCSVDDILSSARSDIAQPFVLVLDQIVDPQNLGAIARTAQCAGIHGIVMPKDRSAPPSPAASKASAGALEHMPLAYVTNLTHALKRFKLDGLWIAGADHRSATSVFEADLSGPLAIVIGGEEKGIRRLVKKQCDFTVSIPQIGPIGSLNASVASAVILYEAFRQRRKDFSRKPNCH